MHIAPSLAHAGRRGRVTGGPLRVRKLAAAFSQALAVCTVQEGGMDSGLAADDQYNLYDKPLFTDRGSNLYRPNKGADSELHGGEGAEEAELRTERFKPTKARTTFLPVPL